ncbi:TetR/AcrR family transcriptional regulator [Sphingobium estronivorans]|uniref:TetR/AcrR family transcriptional regulator n=1 Tax=Sphingobium estronivorans TaxID=1577690 RepID=UPI00123913FB|nr:TetR family transcriptional regulator [Sphingobium estronivorans]
MPTKIPGQDIQRSIVESAMRIALHEGAGSVTLRAVAQEVGIVPSAVIYHFKSLAGLLSAIYALIDESLMEWRAGRLSSLDDPLAHLMPAQAHIAATISHLVRHMSRHALLLQELNRMAVRGDIDLGDRMQRNDEADRHFWRTLFAALSMPADDAEVWTAVAQGLLPLIMLDTDDARRDALISAVIWRTQDRIARRPTPLVPAKHDLPLSPHSPAMPKGKEQIIQAATRIIGAQGLERLTHRRIAAEAGLSLASTTYFYATKNDIVVDAFRAIQRQAVQAVVNERTPQAEFVSTIVLTEEEEERWEMGAMVALNNAAIRSGELPELALTLRQLRGVDGLRWLQARGYRQADQLDGIVWSSATSSLAVRALIQPKGHRRDFLDRQSARIFDELFGLDDFSPPLHRQDEEA